MAGTLRAGVVMHFLKLVYVSRPFCDHIFPQAFVIESVDTYSYITVDKDDGGVLAIGVMCGALHIRRYLLPTGRCG